MSEWDKQAGNWDTDPGPRAYAAEASRSLRQIVARRGVELEGAHVLDFGCGTGHLVGAYDLVVASSVLSFVDDHPATVRELASRLRAGGLLVQWDWELDPTDPDRGGLSAARIRAAMEAAGLRDVEVTTAFVLEVGEDVMRPLVGHGAR